MYKFSENEIIKNVSDVLKLKAEIESVVDGICKEGYKNLFFVGIGGTYAAAIELQAFTCGHSSIDIYYENAADLVCLGNKKLGKGSVLIVSSATGQTPELAEAIDYSHQLGAVVIGFIDDANCAMAKQVDYLFSCAGGSYLKLMLPLARFMYNAGEMDDYEELYENLNHLGPALVNVQKAADEKAAAFAKEHCDDELLYVSGSVCLWGSAYCLAMCYMEEMMWMHTKSVSCSDFFHGTLEIIERDSNVLILMGEDAARKQAERMLSFVTQICRNVYVIDTKDYELVGIDDKFRVILCPMVMAAVYSRIVLQLEDAKKHPMEIRRYYHRLKY